MLIRVAEVGINWDSVETIIKTALEARKAGFEFVKLQVVQANELYPENRDEYKFWKEFELPLSDWLHIRNTFDELGINWFATPFSMKGAKFLAEVLGRHIVKVKSDDLKNLALLRECAYLFDTRILSTGGWTIAEVEEASKILSPDYILHCVPFYPTDPEDAHLERIGILWDKFGKQSKIGYSNHVKGYDILLKAQESGAVLLETHVSLKKSFPEGNFALNPGEMRKFIQKSNSLFIESVTFNPELEKGLYTPIDLKRGEIHNISELKFLRGGNLIPEGYYFVVKRNINRNSFLKEGDVDWMK